MRSTIFLIGVALLLTASPSFAADNCITKHVPVASVSGSGKGMRLFFHVYDATLYAPQGVYNGKKPYALTLAYQVKVKGEDIAQDSVRQMKRLGIEDESVLIKWHQALEKIFPDIGPGDSLTGVHLANGQTLFCRDGHEIGRVRSAEFSRYFFGIWLDKKSEDATLRRNLLEQS